jgi:hypothetical protein
MPHTRARLIQFALPYDPPLCPPVRPDGDDSDPAPRPRRRRRQDDDDDDALIELREAA